ncbi:unnamed protein product [Enterobius vermicularis]|uniref:Thaumatin-like protein 1 n=1 Tax=Enterobius vermicularis TaxID=51028 RepID=A0A0N4V180_ENTVE|nr:unnamed protein product [Enterobius vermicularis]
MQAEPSICNTTEGPNLMYCIYYRSTNVATNTVKVTRVGSLNGEISVQEYGLTNSSMVKLNTCSAIRTANFLAELYYCQSDLCNTNDGCQADRVFNPATNAVVVQYRAALTPEVALPDGSLVTNKVAGNNYCIESSGNGYKAQTFFCQANLCNSYDSVCPAYKSSMPHIYLDSIL